MRRLGFREYVIERLFQGVTDKPWQLEPYHARMRELLRKARSNEEIMAVMRREFPDKVADAKLKLDAERAVAVKLTSRPGSKTEKSTGHVGFVKDETGAFREVIKRGPVYYWAPIDNQLENGERSGFEKVSSSVLAARGFL